MKNVIINTLYHSGVNYPVPSNLTYWWNFGVLGLLCLVVQLLSGIFLAMHYVPNADLAFNSVEHIMRDINNGWFLRYVHANGASMFFLVIYVHVFRGLYYGSYTYPRQLLWCSGVVILLIMILTAFMGYVLPWGQMSFWAATVITNLVSAVPYVGETILNWIWGGYAVDNATLNRFFSLHYLFPFVLTGLVGLHLVFLHEHGSNNSLGVKFNGDKIPFTPYFTIKDIYGVVIFLIVFSYFIFFEPVYLGHPDNFIPANPLSTPNHIVPEWYFLPFYAILRSVPDKLFGVLLLVSSIIVLLIFPFFINNRLHSGFFRPVYKFFFWFFLGDCLILGWLGGMAIEDPFLILGQICTFSYFFYFLCILPGLGYLETVVHNKTINNYILSKDLYINKNMFVNNNNNNKIDSFVLENQVFLAKAFFLVFALAQSLAIYNSGERIPNFSLLFCMYFGYTLGSMYQGFALTTEIVYTFWFSLLTILLNLIKIIYNLVFNFISIFLIYPHLKIGLFLNNIRSNVYGIFSYIYFDLLILLKEYYIFLISYNYFINFIKNNYYFFLVKKNNICLYTLTANKVNYIKSAVQELNINFSFDKNFNKN